MKFRILIFSPQFLLPNLREQEVFKLAGTRTHNKTNPRKDSTSTRQPLKSVQRKSKQTSKIKSASKNRHCNWFHNAFSKQWPLLL